MWQLQLSPCQVAPTPLWKRSSSECPQAPSYGGMAGELLPLQDWNHRWLAAYLRKAHLLAFSCFTWAITDPIEHRCQADNPFPPVTFFMHATVCEEHIFSSGLLPSPICQKLVVINWHSYNTSSNQPRVFNIASPTPALIFQSRDFEVRGTDVPHSRSHSNRWQRCSSNWAWILSVTFRRWVFLSAYWKHFFSSHFCLTSFTRNLLISGLCKGADFQS